MIFMENFLRIIRKKCMSSLSWKIYHSEEGISRQGVHDLVKRCSQTLKGYEEKLHLVEKFVSVREKVKQIDELLDGYEKENAEELVADIRKISDEIIEEL